mmetsp:Transcript_104198/g.222697  ORF Transcript_104198/g.222697 Transcript_104198/m.222697 type:complete len:282 (-) Transcript_104198:16-861(-)
MHLSVNSETTPSEPKPTRAQRNSSASGPSALRRSAPLPGVTIVICVIISSTVGMRAPVPWALTWVQPPICCSVMELKFSKVMPCFLSSSKICDTLAPASTVMVWALTSTFRILSSCDMESMPRRSRERPFGERQVPTGRTFRPACTAQATTSSNCCCVSGEKRRRVVMACVPLQFDSATDASPVAGSGGPLGRKAQNRPPAARPSPATQKPPVTSARAGVDGSSAEPPASSARIAEAVQRPDDTTLGQRRNALRLPSARCRHIEQREESSSSRPVQGLKQS